MPWRMRWTALMRVMACQAAPLAMKRALGKIAQGRDMIGMEMGER